MTREINKQDIIDQLELLRKYKVNYFKYKDKINKADTDIDDVAVFGNQAKDLKDRYEQQIEEGRKLLKTLKTQMEQLEESIFGAVDAYNSDINTIDADKISLNHDDLLYSNSESLYNRLYYCRYKRWFYKQEQEGKVPLIECLVDKAYRLWIVQINLLDYPNDTFDVCNCSGNIIEYKGILGYHEVKWELKRESFLPVQPFVKYKYPKFGQAEEFYDTRIDDQTIKTNATKLSVSFGNYNYQGQINRLLYENNFIEDFTVEAGLIYQRDLDSIVFRCNNLSNLTLNLDVRVAVVNSISQYCINLSKINIAQGSYLDRLICYYSLVDLTGPSMKGIHKNYIKASTNMGYVEREIEEYLQNNVGTNGTKPVIYQNIKLDSVENEDNINKWQYRLAYLPPKSEQTITIPWFISSFGLETDESLVQAFEDLEGDLTIDINNSLNFPLDLSYMFYNTKKIRQLRIVIRNPGLITNMEGMFKGSDVEQIEFLGITQDNKDQFKEIFKDCKKLKSVKFGNSYFNNVTSIEQMFEGCEQLEQVDLTHLTIDSCVTVNRMFYGCKSIKSIVLPFIHFNYIESHRSMFENCYSLTNIKNLDNYVSSHQLDTSRMFFNCRSLKQLYLDGFKMDSVKQTMCMFSGCEQLESIDLRRWLIWQLRRMDGMFQDCVKLKYLQFPRGSESYVQTFDFMFLRCKSLEEIRFTFSIAEGNTVRLKGLFVGCDSLKLVDVSQLYLYKQKYTCEGIFFDMSNREEGHGGRIIVGHNDVTELVDDSVSGETVKAENKLILKGKVEITDSSKIARDSMLNNQYYTLL